MGLATAATVRELGRMGHYLGEHWAVAQGRQPTEGFSVTTRDEGRVVAFAGGINDGAAAAIDKAIGEAPRVGTLLIHSPGGWLREGKRMADVVRRYRLNTRVEGECFSACTLVLLAGANRSAGERARIGFHRGRSIGESADDRSGPAEREETELYRSAGLEGGVRQAHRRHAERRHLDPLAPGAAARGRADALTGLRAALRARRSCPGS